MEVHSRELWHVERSHAEIPHYLRDAKDSRRQAFRFTGRVPVTALCEGRRLRFNTINYSEIGILMTPAEGYSDTQLAKGSTLSGVIGVGAGATEFTGVVLRVDDGERYAIKILTRKTVG
jgi:hypothetical protein